MAHAVETMENNALFLLLFFVLSRARDDGTTDDRTRRRDRTKITERSPELPLDEREQRLGSTGLAWL